MGARKKETQRVRELDQNIRRRILFNHSPGHPFWTLKEASQLTQSHPKRNPLGQETLLNKKT
jgi:hypothetical protein